MAFLYLANGILKSQNWKAVVEKALYVSGKAVLWLRG
jgi:hypothetical protein